MEIPSGLAWWRQRPDGESWLERLPRLVGECAELWSLKVGAAFPGSHVSFVAPVERADGHRAVLKVYFPDLWENEREGDALAHWDGRGAARLLERDRERRALLIERCEPGTLLSSLAEDEADRIATGVLRRLWRPAADDHEFRGLADDATGWAAAFPDEWKRLGRPFEPSLVDVAVAAVRELAPAAQGHAVVLHQDFHSGNVLRAEREPWLAIDPQPLVGERAYDAASLLRERPDGRRRLRRRLDLLAAELDLDRERIRRWAVVHALAWGVSAEWGKVEPELVARARVLAAI